MTDKISGSLKCALLALVMLILICAHSWFAANSTLHFTSIVENVASEHRSLQQRPHQNKVTFLYVVGVEGVGHHGVTPALATIGRSCQNYVYYESKFLRAVQKNMGSSYASNLMRMKETAIPTASTGNILIVEDSSFPTDHLHRQSSNEIKKSAGMYNLEWVYDNAKRADLNIKFLYLNRDFYRTVSSHPEFDGDYQAHAKVLHDFVWYIHEEYQRIEAKEPGLWKQINYEWFTNMEDCPALVASLIEFVGWNECNIAQACAMLRSQLREPTKRVVNEEVLAYTNQFNVTLPIPVLNITSGAEHRIPVTTPIDTTLPPRVRAPSTNDSSVDATWEVALPWHLRVQQATTQHAAAQRATAPHTNTQPIAVPHTNPQRTSTQHASTQRANTPYTHTPRVTLQRTNNPSSPVIPVGVSRRAAAPRTGNLRASKTTA